MILVRCLNVPYFGYSKVIGKGNDGQCSYLSILVFLLGHHLGLTYGYLHFDNDLFPNFSSSSLNYPSSTINHFPITQTSPYFDDHQFDLTNYFANYQQSSTFLQPTNPTFTNLWSLHQSSPFVNTDSNSDGFRGGKSDGGGSGRGNENEINGDRGDRGDVEEVDSLAGENANEEVEKISNSAIENHEKQAEKNTEKMWPQPPTNRRFGLLSKLFKKNKDKKKSNKHKHDHFHHQSVHHHHHHHHYHHHIHHYPGKKPNAIKSAMKKFKYKWKFKSKVKEIGEAPPTQHIYDQPTPVYPYYSPPPPPPLPSHLHPHPPLPPPPPNAHHYPHSRYTVQHHYPGQNSW